jgi:serine protease
VTNHGGPVQTAPKVYVDFWHWTSDPSGEQPYLEQFLSSVGSTSWLATVSQYGAGWTGQLLAGTWSDSTNLVPSHPTDAQIQAEAVVAANHFGVGNSVNVQIVVATPTGHSTSGFGTSFCAYHGAVAADPSITYTDLPYMTDAGGSCGEDSVNGSNGTLDGVSIVEGHELAESITDPLVNAWYDASGNEIADKCVWTDLANLATAAGNFPVQPLWSNAGNGCAQSPASPLSGVLTSDGTVLAKAGSLAAAWNQESSGVSQVSMATDSANGPLIGTLTSNGEAFAAQGLLNSPVSEYTGVKEVAVASDPVNGPLIAVLTTGGEVLVKEGGLSAAWTDEDSGVSQIAVASDPVNGPLIGVVTTGGEALVKEGGLSAAWTDEDSGVSQIALASDSTDGPVISILTTSGIAYTKEGGLSTAWVHEYTGASQIAVASDTANGPLIGVVTTGGEALVKEGGPATAWTDEDSGVSQLSLASDPTSGPLIGVLISGAAYAKQGSLSAAWTHEYTGAYQVASTG